jgi:hypothetical protein
MLSNLRFTVGQIFLQLKYKFYNAKQKEDYTGYNDGPRINPITLENESLPPKRERDLLSTISLLENDKDVLMEKLTSSQKVINELTEKLSATKAIPGESNKGIILTDGKICDLDEYTDRYFSLCTEIYGVLISLLIKGRCHYTDVCEITTVDNEITKVEVVDLIEGIGSSPYTNEIPNPAKITSIAIKSNADTIIVKSQPLISDKVIEFAFREKTLYHFRTNPQ